MADVSGERRKAVAFSYGCSEQGEKVVYLLVDSASTHQLLSSLYAHVETFEEHHATDVHSNYDLTCDDCEVLGPVYARYKTSSSGEEPPTKKAKTSAGDVQEAFLGDLARALSDEAEQVNPREVHTCAVMATINIFSGN